MGWRGWVGSPSVRYAHLRGGGRRRLAAVLAADWNRPPFESRSVNDALRSLGVSAMSESADIQIKAPDIAENGALVPIEATSRIAGTTRISVIAEKNPTPLAADFGLAGDAEGYLSFRIKMSQTSNVRVVVAADGRHYTAAKEVKVTIGGCVG